tara:strand:- start:1570 stop:2415 length:846 start_codon:yes stop_codon:yes gene_type:complete
MKIALCLFGIVGGHTNKAHFGSSIDVLNKGFECYQKNILSRNDVDVFVHSWSTEMENEIVGLYEPKKYIIEPQKYFNIPRYVKGSKGSSREQKEIRKQNHYSRWCSTYECIKLKKKYELENDFVYDFVITSRFDVAWQRPILFENLDSKTFYASRWPRWFDENGKKVHDKDWFGLLDKYGVELKSKYTKKYVGYPYNNEGLLDLWFLSNSEFMDKFASLYSNLDEYNKRKNSPRDDSGSISNHRLSLYHLDVLGLKNNIKLIYDLHDDCPLVRRKYFLTNK